LIIYKKSTLGKFFNNKTCIYLDQYVISNLIDSSDEIWVDLKSLLIRGINSGKFIIPYSFEHLIETSQRSIDKAKEHDKFLFDLSQGVKISGEPLITSRIIRNRIRKRLDSLTTFSETVTLEQMQTDTEYDFYKKLKNEYDSKVEEATRMLNIFRDTDLGRFDSAQQNETIQSIIDRDASHIADRLKSFGSNGFFERRNVKFSDGEIPFWADVIIDILTSRHKITRKEALRGSELIKNNGLKIIPTVYIRSSIEGLMAVKQQKETVNDHVDITRLSTSLPFADIVFTDKARQHDLLYLGLDKEFKTKVYSGKRHDLLEFKNELEQILM
jgi:hypothetical protein